MNTQHEKSPCCQGKFKRFGGRRRQCLSCGHTWSVWKRKRGRSRRRINTRVIEEYLDHTNGSLQHQATVRGLSAATWSARVRQALGQFNQQTSWPRIPNGPLIAIADGMWQWINGELYTIYFIFFRTPTSSQAVIAPPLLVKGNERGSSGWFTAFERLPEDVHIRIVALVCDGNQSLVGLARYHQWKLQRCQFHLLARLTHYASIGKLQRSQYWGEYIRPLVYTLLYESEERKVQAAQMQLNDLLPQVPSIGLRRVLRGFLKYYLDYRTYLQFPELHLPRTSNTAEAFIAQARELLHIARGFRTPQALIQWIEALCKHRKTIACHGVKKQQN